MEYALELPLILQDEVLQKLNQTSDEKMKINHSTIPKERTVLSKRKRRYHDYSGEQPVPENIHRPAPDSVPALPV